MRLHHLALRTRDVDSLEAFYAGLVGLPCVRRDGTRSVWLALGDAVLMIERADDAEPAPDPRSMELVALAARDATERDAIEARLRARDVAIEARTAHTIYFRDPEGRRVGISTYPIESVVGTR
ncbi:MAG: VOC family protein [Myxococcota bacterium]|jgi:catechol-2,3-dioxygenase|nr:VOC family protein [Myxococcota bacterium]